MLDPDPEAAYVLRGVADFMRLSAERLPDEHRIGLGLLGYADDIEARADGLEVGEPNTSDLASIPVLSAFAVDELRKAHVLPTGERYGDGREALAVVLHEAKIPQTSALYWSLKRAGIQTLAQVQACDDAELLKLHGVGRAFVAAIRRAQVTS